MAQSRTQGDRPLWQRLRYLWAAGPMQTRRRTERAGPTRRLLLEVLEDRFAPARLDWMGQLAGNLHLGQISVPGSHDTMAYTALARLAPGASTQSLTLTEQLQAGIRYIDIRPGQLLFNPIDSLQGGSGDDLLIHNGTAPLGVFFKTDVFDVCQSFLDSNPSETIVMRVGKEEGNITDSQVAGVVNELIAQHADYWYTAASVPTLAEVRKKIVLVRDYAGSGGIVPQAAMLFSNGAGGTTAGSYAENDVQAPGGGPLAADVAALKFNNFVKPSLDTARATPTTEPAWFVTGTSATWDLSNGTGYLEPQTIAIGYPLLAINPVNQRLDDYLAGLTAGRVGTIAMDFAGYRDLSATMSPDTVLIDRVVDLNFGTTITPDKLDSDVATLIHDKSDEFVGGVDSVFSNISDTLHDALESLNLPVIGDQINAGLQSVYDNLDYFATQARDAIQAVLTGDRPLDELPNLVQETLFAALGPGNSSIAGIGLLKDGADDGADVNLSDVIVSSGRDINGRIWLQYDFHLGQELTLSLPSFDLGLAQIANLIGAENAQDNPDATSQFQRFFETFGFNVSSAGIAVDLAWDLRLGFGVSSLLEHIVYLNSGATDGTEEVPELQLTLDIHAAPSSEAADYEAYLAGIGERSNLRMQASLGLVQSVVTDGTPVTLQVSAVTPQPDTISLANYAEDFDVVLDYPGTEKDRTVNVNYTFAGTQSLTNAMVALNLQSSLAFASPLPPVFFTLTYDADLGRAAFITMMSRDPDLEHLSIRGAEKYGFLATQHEDFRARGLGFDNNSFSASNDNGETQELLAASPAPVDGVLRDKVDMVVWIGGQRAVSNGLQVTEDATEVALSLEGEFATLEELRAAVEEALQDTIRGSTSLPSTIVTVEIEGDRLKLISHRDVAGGFADAPLLSVTFFEVENTNLQVVASLDITNPDFDEGALEENPDDQAFFNRVGLLGIAAGVKGGGKLTDYFVPHLGATATIRLHVNADSNGVVGFVAQNLGLAPDVIGLPEFSFDLQVDVSMDLGALLTKSKEESASDSIGIDAFYFNNVTLDLSKFLKTVVGPIASAAAELVEPVFDVIGNSTSDPDAVLNTRLPGISDILDETVTLADVLPADLQTGLKAFLDGVNDVANMAEDIAEYVQSDEFINDLTDNGKVHFGGFELVMDPTSFLYFPRRKVPIPIGLRDILDQAPNPDDFFSLESTFDIVDPRIFRLDILKPQTAIDYLLGNDVDLVSIGLPVINYEGSASFGFDFQALAFNVGAEASFNTNLRLSYDTKGISNIIGAFRAHETPDWTDLLDGFGITADPDLPELGISAGFTGSGKIELTEPIAGTVIFGASGSIDVGAGLRLDIIDPDEDGKLRLDEISDLTNGFTELEHLFCIFDIAGSAHATVTGSATIVGVTYDAGEIGLFDVGFSLQDLLSDNFGLCTDVTPDPVLGEVVTEEGETFLRLNTGPFAAARLNGDVSDDGDDPFTFLVEDAVTGDVELNAVDADEPVTFAKKADGSYASPEDDDSTLKKVNGLFERHFDDFFRTKQYFDSNGRLSKVEDNRGATSRTTYTYDSDGRLSRVDRDDGTHATFAHGAQITAKSVPGGIAVSGYGVTDQVYTGTFAKVLGVGGDLDDSFDLSGVAGTTVEVRAGDGNDLVKGGSGNDALFGGAGDDDLQGGAGNDSIDTGSGAGTVSDGAGDDEVSFAGSDAGVTFTTSGGNDSVIGSAFDDTITAGGGGNVDFMGGDGDDTLTGGSGADELAGEGGADRLFGLGGGDVLRGGSDDDTLDGGADADQLVGGDDADTVKGGLGADILHGEQGDDTVVAGFGDITVDGGSGEDVFLLATDAAANTTLVDGSYVQDGTSILYTNFESIQVALGDFVNVLTIDGPTLPLTLVQGGARDDTVIVASLPADASATRVQLGAGNDTLRVVDTRRSLLVNGNGNSTTGSDTLVLDLSSSATSRSGFLKSDQVGAAVVNVLKTSSLGDIHYDTFERVDIRLSSSADELTVASTPAHVATTISAAGGDDRVLVYAVGGPTTIDGAAGEDRVTLAISDAAATVPAARFASLTFAGVEELVVDNRGSTAPGNWRWQDGQVFVGATPIVDTIGVDTTIIQGSTTATTDALLVSDTVQAPQSVAVTGQQVTIEEGATVLTPGMSANLENLLYEVTGGNLFSVTSTAVSPDGNFLYATGNASDNVAVFRRATDGSLTFVEMLQQGINGVTGLVAPMSIAVNAGYVYVGSGATPTVVAFGRSSLTGRLSFLGTMSVVTPVLDLALAGDNLYGVGGPFVFRASGAAAGQLALREVSFDFNFQSYHHIAVGVDGADVFVAADHFLSQFHLGAGGALPAGPTFGTGVGSNLRDLAAAPNHTLYVALFGGIARLAYTANGFSLQDTAEGLPPPNLTQATAVSVDPSGTAVVAAFDINSVTPTPPRRFFNLISLHVINANDPASGDEPFVFVNGTTVYDAPDDSAPETTTIDLTSVGDVELTSNIVVNLSDDEAVGTQPVGGDLIIPPTEADGFQLRRFTTSFAGTVFVEYSLVYEIYSVPQPTPPIAPIIIFSRNPDGVLHSPVQKAMPVNPITSLSSVDGHYYGTNPGQHALTIDDNPTFIGFSQQTSPLVPGAGAIEAATALSPTGDFAYVVSARESAIMVLDTSAPLGAPLQVLPIDGLTQAGRLSVHADNAYVTNADDSSIYVFGRDAATGLLTYRQFVGDGLGTIDGLGGASDIALSPDGNFLYAAGRSDNALAILARDSATGLLAFSATVTHADLSGPRGLLPSADGKFLYVSAANNVLVFSRDAATGGLTHVQTLSDGTGGVDGLAGAGPLALSSDAGQTSLFVAGQAEDSVAVFQRNAATGGLAFTQVLRNGQNGVRGIEGVTALATSLPASGNQYLFVSGRSETLAVLGQGADGTWRMLQRVRNGAASVTGLEAPRGLTVSPDGQRLYIASGGSATTPGSLAFLSISQAAPPPITYSVQHANMESLTVSSAAGSDVVAAAGVTIPFTLDTGGGDDDVRLTSAPAATRVNLGAGGDTVSVLSTGAAVRIDGGLGDDAFTAKGRALGGTLTLNGDGHTTGDTLTFDSQNGTVTQVQQSATSGTLNVVGAAFGVSYATIENVGVRANPFASAGGPYTTAEGSPLTLDAGASTRPAGHTDAAPAYEWDVNGDGGFGDATGANPTLSWATLQALGVDDDGVYQVTVRYTTTLGGNTFTDVGVSTLTITNTAPTLTLAGPATVETGRVYTLNLSATDAGDDTARRWLVNWDDGSVPETFFGNPSVARHTFTAAGQHTIQATVTDEDGSFPDTAGAVQQTALAVDVVSVVRAISGPGTTIEGSPYRLALQAIGGAAASIQKWSINWGDGSVQDVAGNPAEVQHTYADDGAFTIAARVTEGDGAVRSAASAVNVRVQNAAPVLVSAASNSPLRQGDTLTLTVNATDAGPQDVLTYGFDFDDDGSFEVSGTSATVQKVYQAAGEHLLRVRVSDDDGAAAVRVLRIVVNNAAPVIGAVTVETSNPREASPVVFRVSASDRGGSADPLTYAFDFDNNGIYEVTSPASVVTHRFADNGTYTVGVKVRDGSGVEATSSVQVNVANVNPSIVAVATGARVKEGTPSTLTVIASDVAGSNDPLTYDFDLDNDGAYEISNATGSVSKTYPDNGTFTFSVRVRDDDGGVATVQQTVAVFNQAPVFELGADATLAPGTTFSRSGGFTDAGADTWTATVDYGDGLGARPLPLGPGKTFQLTRLASLPDGDHTIQVVITDDDGMRSVDAVKISVRTPAPAGPTEAELLHQLHVQQVQFLYRSLVGRLPTDRAAQVWVAALDAGTPLDSVGRAIARTPEFSLRMINDIYKQYLGRNARAAEVRPLLAAARLGRFERIRASVLGSAAYFKQRARNSRARFLNVLAGDVLGRSLDRRTKASLQVKLAQGVTRTNIALPLLTSQPGAARIVQRLVRKYGSARDNQRELATTLRLGASERDIILFMVLGRA